MTGLDERRKSISDWFRQLQLDICSGIQDEDGCGRFKEDVWERPGGGGGHTRILEDGDVIEKGGVNFSAVYGTPPESTVAQAGFDPSRVKEFFATGVSIVMHPKNPMVPIIHMNVRYFDLGNHTWWFGGGIDLTPHYVKPDDARYFHRSLKEVCDRFHPDYYREYKRWADDYFFINHRNETRGVGGIFFDYLKEDETRSFESLFGFVQAVGTLFPVVYRELMRRNRSLPFEQRHKDWQLVRRGRYVEFNLVLDRGTRFGLESHGRTESILMSLPPAANWIYNQHIVPGTEEAETLSWLRKGIDWTREPQN